MRRKIPDVVPGARATLPCMDTITSRDDLIRYTDAGGTVKYLPFWGHAPRRDGQLGASCLSQWWPSPFTVAGIRYETAEHWMMAGKARLFGDAEAERRALDAATPAEAKIAGRLVQGFDEAVWNEARFALVTEGSTHKFASDPALRAFLVGTGERVLVEASPLDRIWGSVWPGTMSGSVIREGGGVEPAGVRVDGGA